jgi:prepilin-type N-terminal cleavage/methylation domain-containing protein
MTSRGSLPATWRRTSRLAFTLVEMLVVIAIIGTLVALLIPAVQAARESGRRTACGNKLRQLGVALHGFESSQGAFPPLGWGYGGCVSDTDGDTAVYNGSGMLRLLPFLDQQQLYDRFNVLEAISDSYYHGSLQTKGSRVGNPLTNGNADLACTVLEVFRCPSDPTSRDEEKLNDIQYGPGGIGNGTRRGAATNYDFLGIREDFTRCNTWRTLLYGVTRENRGMFGESSSARAAMVTDGLSHTLAMGETTRFHDNGAGLAWAYRNTVMVAGVVLAVDKNEGRINVWTDGFTPGRVGRVRSWDSSAASAHPGGCHFARGDGGVVFLAETTESQLLSRLRSMADRQPVTIP